ncbi:cytochrome b [soil metagenome]
MPLRNTSRRYGSLSIAFHWLIVLQLIGVYACINLTDLFPKNSDPRVGLLMWHYMLGLSVLVVVVLRIANRLSGPVPGALPGTPRWQNGLAAATHLSLYALLLAMPVLGWLTLSASGEPIPFFGASLPALVGPDKALAHQLREIHETLGVVGYYLIGLHVAAALFHHYLRRDGTLQRMLPFLRVNDKGAL